MITCSYLFSMDLKKILVALDKLAPLNLAAKWDNVGLLVEPSFPHLVKKIMLTNDLTEPVLKEAIDWKANMIVSYHPPIFDSLKRITNAKWKERLIVQALENKIAIYSPHTACDAMLGGVNDWLSAGLGDLSMSKPIKQLYYQESFKLLTVLKQNSSTSDQDLLFKTATSNKSFNKTYDTEMLAPCNEVNSLFSGMNKNLQNNAAIINLDSKPIKGAGFGRICDLKYPTSIIELVNKIKDYLHLHKVRLAIGEGWSINDLIKTVALCAGSGGSILKGVNADLFLTGEMSHHDILDAVANRTSVIICEHSNTERGFLNQYKNMIINELNVDEIQVEISQIDKDPVEIY